MPTCPLACQCVLHSKAFSYRPVCPDLKGCPGTGAEVGDLFVGSNYGQGFANTDGQALSQATYPELFSRVGIQPDFEAETIVTYPNNMLAMAYGNGLYVGMNASQIFVSSDTVNWKVVNTFTSMLDITFCSGLGLFVIAQGTSSGGYNALRSSDGINWSASPVQISNPSSTSIARVASSPTTIVFAHISDLNVVSQYVYTSTDAINFTRQTIAGTVGIQTLFFSPGNPGTPQFLIGTSLGAIQTSPDGITWTTRTSNVASSLNQIAYAPTGPTGVLVAVGTNGVITRSDTDGTTWQAATYQATLLNGVAFNQNTGTWIASGNIIMLSSTDASGTSGTWTTQLSSQGGKGSIFYGTKYVECGDNGLLADSNDLTTWTSRVSKTVASQFSGAYGVGTAGPVYTIVGATTASQYSTDGVNWNLTGNAALQTQTHVVFWPKGTSGIFVSCGAAGTVQTSPDGITWTNRTANLSGQTANALAFSPDIMVAVANNGALATTPDGTTWTAQTSNAGTVILSSVAWNGTIFCAVGGPSSQGVIITSPDGSTWSRQTPNMSLPRGNNALNRIVSDGTTSFYAATTSTTLVSVSNDGINWTTYSTPLFGQSLEWVNGQLITSSGGNIARSTDQGKTWTMLNNRGTMTWRTAYYFPSLSSVLINQSTGLTKTTNNQDFSTTYSSQYNLVVYGNGKLIALGNNLLISKSLDDGATWTMNTSLSMNTGSVHFSAVAYSEPLDRFVAVTSNAMIYYSTDGDVWTQAVYTHVSFNYVQSPAFNDVIWIADFGRFVIVGTNGMIVSSPDGINWTTIDVNQGVITLKSICYNTVLKRVVAMANGVTFLVTDDLVNWTVAFGSSINTTSVETLENDGFVAIGTGNSPSLYSDDGFVWNRGALINNIASSQSFYSGVDKAVVAISTLNLSFIRKNGIIYNQSNNNNQTYKGLDYDPRDDSYVIAGNLFEMTKYRRTYNKGTQFIIPTIDNQSIKTL